MCSNVYISFVHISVFYYRPKRGYEVMFSQASLSLFTGGFFVPGCTTGHMTRGSLSRGSLSKWGSLSRGFCPRGGLCPWGSLSTGVSVWGGFCLGVSVWGFSVQGGPCLGVSVWGSLLRDSSPRTVMSRWYTSYLNVFLLELFSYQHKIDNSGNVGIKSFL